MICLNVRGKIKGFMRLSDNELEGRERRIISIMKKLGFYTLRIYNEEEFDTVQECAICLHDADVENGAYFENVKRDKHLNCTGCNGCPESKMNRGKR